MTPKSGNGPPAVLAVLGAIVRHAEIRDAGELGVDVVAGDLHRVDRLPRAGDERAVAVVGDIAAAGDAGILEQAAGADRQRRADHLVDVERHALGAIGAERGVHVVEAVLRRRLLGDDVDRAAGGAAARKGRARAAQDLDLLGEEVLADANAGVAHAVDEDVVARVEAADEEAVAEGIAALARAERDAGRRQDRRLQRCGVLVFEHVLGQHRDRFRRVQDRLGIFPGRLQTVALVRRGRIRIGIAVGGKTAGVGKRHRRLLCLLVVAARGAAQRVAGTDLVRSGL
ncbi:hypothetical protein ABIF15_000717 [Bradyrhizobium elkanii]